MYKLFKETKYKVKKASKKHQKAFKRQGYNAQNTAINWRERW